MLCTVGHQRARYLKAEGALSPHYRISEVARSDGRGIIGCISEHCLIRLNDLETQHAQDQSKSTRLFHRMDLI